MTRLLCMRLGTGQSNPAQPSLPAYCETGRPVLRRTCGLAYRKRRVGYGLSHVWPRNLSSDVSEIKIVFSIPPHRPTPNFPPSRNVAPTDPLPVVGVTVRPASAASTSCVGAWCRIGRRISRLGSQYQRNGRNRRHGACVSRSVPTAPLFGPGGRLL